MKEFFESNDWFGRSGPFAYNTEYIIFIVLAIALAFVLPILLRKKESKAIKTALIILWAIAVVLDITKYVYNWVSHSLNGTATVDNLAFPFWTCSMYLYIMPIALFCKNEKVSRACSAFICTISFFAGIVNFAIPAEESLFSFPGLHKIVYHYILMLTPAVMLGTGYFKLKLKDILGVMIVFIICAVPVYIFNAVFKQDYMYTYNGSWLPFDVSAVSTIKPLYTLLSIAGYALLTLLFIGIDIGIRKLAQKKHKKA